MPEPAATALETVQDTVTELADKDVDSTDSQLRYMAYAARLRTALRASSRYIAYVRHIIPSEFRLLVHTNSDQ